MKLRGRFHIVGVIRQSTYHPSFSVAVLKSDHEPGYWLQVKNPGKFDIAGFAGLSGIDYDDIQPVTPILVSIGEPYRFAFIDTEDKLCIQSVDDLRSNFESAASHPATREVVKLSIAEILNDRSGARNSLDALVDSMAASMGRDSARTLRNTAVQARLWDLLEENASSEAALDRIRAIRPRIGVRIDNEEIDFDFATLSPQDIRIEFDELKKFISSEFTFGSISEYQLGGLDTHFEETAPKAPFITSVLNRHSDEGERAAILIDLLVRYPEQTVEAMAKYTDRNSTVRKIVATLRLTARQFQQISSEEDRDIRIAKVMPNLIAGSDPISRGHLFYCFAWYLAKFKHINAALRNSVDSSLSIHTDSFRDKINSLLSDDSSDKD